MTGRFFLDWLITSLSLFNTILLIWLGLTVLLNSDRKRLGVWVASLGLLVGGGFFTIHSYMVSHPLNPLSREVNSLWYLSWLMLVSLPFAWYILILWYSGFWNKEEVQLRKWQKYFFPVLSIIFFFNLRLVLFKDTLPSFVEFTQISISKLPSLYDFPLLVFIYPVYILICTILSINALLISHNSTRIMGEMARNKAKPWLILSSVMLFIVSILVSSFMIWIVFNSFNAEDYNSLTAIATLTKKYAELLDIIGLFDITISFLISMTILFLGQAITSYEIFTGKTLPRRGLFRNWLSVIFLAGSYGIIVGAGLNSPLSPIYYLLFTTLLMTLFYSLSNWRFYNERERYIQNLRPFIKNEHIYEQLLLKTNESLFHIDIKTPFIALCENILEAETAYLIPIGSLSAFVDNLSYPAEECPDFFNLNEVIEMIANPESLCFYISPEKYYKSILAVPLWSEKGLIGLILLGNKKDGGFYTQEEIEIARTAGERFLDTKASSQMALWLMELQRKKITETKINDQRTKRVLHDDILPLIHTSMIDLSSNENNQEALNVLSDVHHKVSTLLRELPNASNLELEKIGLFNSIKKLLDIEFKASFDKVNFDFDNNISEKLTETPIFVLEVVFYALREVLRNSAKYGKKEEEETDFILNISTSFQEENNIAKIIIEDNGRGISKEEKQPKGSGQGLGIHSTMLAVIGGSLYIDSKPNIYTKVELLFPVKS
jgi:two-component sensor histidine kinase